MAFTIYRLREWEKKRNREGGGYSDRHYSKFRDCRLGFVYLNAGLLVRSQYESGRSCNRPTGFRFSACLFAPTANAPLILKIQDALRASHVDLLTLTSKFSPKCCPPNIKCRPNAQLLSSAAYSQQSTSHHRTFLTSQRIISSPNYPYEKDERAWPGNLQSRTQLCFPIVIIKL